VVRPQRDHLVPEAWTERVAELIPDSELVTLPKAAHAIGHRAATRLAALVTPFLAESDEAKESADAAESDDAVEEPASS
jgi:pimeloyl-ACP methyl ester carboxylesterase